MGKPTVSTVLGMAFAWMLPVLATAEEMKRTPNPAADINVSATRIDWLLRVDAESWVLTLTGPGEIFLQQEFEGGKAPFLSLFDAKGDRLPDGGYTWELRGAPRSDDGSRDELIPRRVRPLVLSGHFSVKAGGFVTPPAGRTEASPRPPLQNVTARDSIETGNLVVQQNACIGNACGFTDASFSALKLKAFSPSILFDGVENPEDPSGSPQDWALLINQSGAAQFSVADFTNALIPFSIAAGAPDNSLYVAASGNLGLGTSTPAVRLDAKVNSSGKATARVQNTSATGWSGIEYLDNIGNVDLFFGIDNANSTTRLSSLNNNPIVLLTNSSERMRVTSTGDIGIGTASPSVKLHVSGTAGTTKLLVHENSATTLSREVLELRNNGGTVLVLDDTSIAQRWVLATNGTSLITNEQSNAGVEMTLTNTGSLTIAGTLTQGSSRDFKTAIVPLNPKDVLARVSSLPVSLWSYKTDEGARHIGPMAEDFHQAFGLGEDDKHIAPGDQAGVALLAVQGLDQIVQEKIEEIAALRRENADLAKRLAALETLISKLMPER